VGDPLNQVKAEAFFDELEKVAIASFLARAGRGLQKNLLGAAERIIHPVRGIKAGWRELTPALKMKSMAPAERAAHLKGGWLGKPGEHLKGALGTSRQDLLQTMRGTTAEAAKKGRLRATAEELSRRGWTGQGARTKYLPVGDKGQIALMTAPAAPEVVKAMRKEPTATGEGAGAESGLGELGGLAGWVAGSGLGLPGMAMWYGGQKAGEYAGRAIDRLRGGASLGTALAAPSRREAIQQLSNIRRFHG